MSESRIRPGTGEFSRSGGGRGGVNGRCGYWTPAPPGSTSRSAASSRSRKGFDDSTGSVEADVARGLALRMDHGSLSDHFLNQLRYWGIHGIHPSFGFLEEPETNGVVERWNRTLKE